MSQKCRLVLVVLGIIAAQLAMKMLTLHAALWFTALLIAWAMLMTGMFARNRARGNAPLVLGTVGAALLIVTNFDLIRT